VMDAQEALSESVLQYVALGGDSWNPHITRPVCRASDSHTQTWCVLSCWASRCVCSVVRVVVVGTVVVCGCGR
jgi:hypothetical protein